MTRGRVLSNVHPSTNNKPCPRTVRALFRMLRNKTDDVGLDNYREVAVRVLYVIGRPELL